MSTEISGTSSSSQQDAPPDNSTEGEAPRRQQRLAHAQSGTNLLADIATHLETPDKNVLADAEAAAARFDMSPFRLWLLFQSVDENQDGFITKTELVDALTSASSTRDLSQRQMSVATKGEPNDLGESGLEFKIPLQEIQALDELFERVIGPDQATTPTNSSTSLEEKEEDDQTTEHRNFVPPPAVGISFPQFCRIMRYLWLQQLLNSELDNPSDPDNHYAFECVDYSSGYYRHKKITGNLSEKGTRDFFTAPRHGHARMRWIDVPSGTFVPGCLDPNNHQNDSFRITILRLAVKYRFHPTSIEDAIDLDWQEPKVNSFEHSLLDLGNFNCGTISWLRNAGDCLDADIPSHQQLGDWAQEPGNARRIRRTSTVSTNDQQHHSSSAPSLPRPRPAHLRASSTGSFHSYYHREAGPQQGANIPYFVMAEGEDSVNMMNEGRHYFITIPMFELSRRSQTSLELYKEASELLPAMQIQPLTIEVNEATLGIFVASLPDANLVVTCSTKWRPTRIKPFKDQLRAMNGPASSRQSAFSQKATARRGYGSFDGGWGNNSDNDSSRSSSSDDTESDRFMQSMLQDEKASLERVKGLLKKRHSIQRHRSSNWLMHAIIDAVVDNLVPISKIYEAQLQRMSTQLFELQHQLSKLEVKRMIVMRRELEWLQHELRPFARVIRHLIDDRNIGIEVTHYLEDIEDHLLRTLEELSSYAAECISLKDEYNAYLDRRMNDILYVLTLVTTLMVPGQFFTGYYGMNFEKDGELGIPMLRLGTLGVVIFWCMSLSFTALIVLLMYRNNFFEKDYGSKPASYLGRKKKV